MELVPNCSSVQEQAEQINAWMDMRAKEERILVQSIANLEAIQIKRTPADNLLADAILRQEFLVEGPPSQAEDSAVNAYTSHSSALRIAEAGEVSVQRSMNKVLVLANEGIELGIRHIDTHMANYHPGGQTWCYANKHPKPPRGKRVFAAAIHLGVVVRELFGPKNKPTGASDRD